MRKGKVILGIFLVLIAAYVISCQEKVDTDVYDDHFSIANAKKWYEETQTGFVAIKLADETEEPFVMMPEWSDAFESNNSEYEVVETGLKSNGNLSYASEESYQAYEETGDEGYLKSLSRLVMMKNKATGEITSFLITIIGSKEYLGKHGFKLDDNSYLKKQHDFSGMILVYDLEGYHISSQSFEEGVEILSPESDSDEQSSISRLTTVKECRVTTVYLTTSISEQVYTNGEWVTVWTIKHTFQYSFLQCFPSYPGANGNPPSGNPDPRPQIQARGAAALPAIYGQSLLTSSQKTTLEFELGKMLEVCALERIYLEIKNRGIKLNFRTGVGNPANYNPWDKTISFYNETNITYLNLAEQLFHAYQDVAYTGGISQYTWQAGHHNIDLEAKMLMDIVYRCVNLPCNTSISGVTASGFSGSWTDFINRITQNGTFVPRSALSAQNLAIYYEFLRKYSADKGPQWASYSMPPNVAIAFLRDKVPATCL